MSYRSFLKKFLPYSFVVNYLKRNKQLFSFENDADVGMVSFDQTSLFKTIVSVEGFGYSGSGAVVDLLREYSEVSVMGSVDAEGSLAKKNEFSQEMDFIRLTGGLFELEKYIGSNNVFFNDAVIHRLIKLVQCSKVFALNKKARVLFNKFFNEIVDFQIGGLETPMYNAYLNDADTTIFFLKEIPIAEYRRLCTQLIVSIFNCYKEIDKDILVADQLFSDLEFDVTRNQEYIPNLKTIVVYRDPRDVFAFANTKKVPWIPYTDVNTYIKWVKLFYKRFDLNSQSMLIVRYEDLIYDYEKEITRIEDYLHLKSHIAPKTCFDPSISSKYVGLWNRSTVNQENFKLIYANLTKLCYGA